MTDGRKTSPGKPAFWFFSLTTEKKISQSHTENSAFLFGFRQMVVQPNRIITSSKDKNNFNSELSRDDSSKFLAITKLVSNSRLLSRSSLRSCRSPAR